MKTVLVFFDTLRRDAVSPYNRTVATPNFSRLAERSTTCTNHYAGSMPCMPARRELHTGRYNFLHRSWGPLEPFDFSMPRALADHGVHSHLVSDHYHYWEGGGATYHTRYRTWDVVRGQEGDPWIPRPGFDDLPEAIGCPHRSMTDQDEINRRWMVQNGYHPQRETFNRGVSFLEENASTDNWFLQIETFDPHEPFWSDEGTSDPLLSAYTGPRFDWPAYGPVTESPEQVDHVNRRYHELVRMCDRNLGRVLDCFDRHNLWRDTAIIVTTDHGFLLGEHGQWGKVVQPLFQEVVHIPLFVHIPKTHRDATSGGTRSNALTQTVDLAPTILALHGVDLPPGPGSMAAGGAENRTADEREGTSTDHMDGVPLQASITGAYRRDLALFGVFGGHVCVTDGASTYFHAPDPARPVYEHTLMPWGMREPFSDDQLAAASLVRLPGFARGFPVMRYPGHLHSPKMEAWFQHLLFDLADDPQQSRNLLEPDVEAHPLGTAWRRRLVDALQTAGAPSSLYERLRLQ